MNSNLKTLLEKQHYTIIGNHSAQKVCEYVKKSLIGKDVCYKQKFYGIQSHRCVQMTPAVNHCTHGCVFCWRAMDFNEGIKIKEVDSPEKIIEESILAQLKKINGFKGNNEVNMKKFLEAQNPIHFAISLSGEPTLYKKLPRMLSILKKKKISTFVVSNGMFPEMLKKIKPTQLYLSIFAPDKKLYEQISRTKISGAWKNLMKSLNVLKEKRKEKVRTALRITLIKNMNMLEAEKYAEIIKKSNPLFVEVKAYMFIGSSRKRLDITNMPLHQEVRDFAIQIGKHCGYRLIDEKKESRVVLLMKKDFKGRIMKF